jgi:valyl-tRNA synthetase
VLDTWFSSWLWPFSTLGWPDETDDLHAFYPTSTLVTAPEILFFWVARMIMAGLEFRGEVPFTDVYLNGTVRDLDGRKMSKSLGNGIDPLEVVQLFGADALRYTVIAASGLGTDLFMDYRNLEETFKPGRNFANKVWNAARLVLMNLGTESVLAVAEVEADLEIADRWILSRLNAAVREVDRQLTSFRFKEAADAAYHFFWGEFADWYLEMVKPRLRGDAGDASRTAAKATLVAVMDGVLRLLHPMIPFITEALWLRLPIAGEREPSLVVAAWPVADARLDDPGAEAEMAALTQLIGTVRTLRSEYGVPDGSRVRVELSNVNEALRAALAVEERAVRQLAQVAEVETGGNGSGAGAHAIIGGGTELFIPLAGVIDLDRERERLHKELERLDRFLQSTEAKLANESFVGRAPADVIARERDKANGLRDQRDRLSAKLASLG